MGSATEWREHIAIAKAPANAAQLALWIHSINGSFAKADIDDFSVSVVSPEEAVEIEKAIAKQKTITVKATLFPVPTAKRIAEIAAMLPEKPAGPCPKASDRTAWQPLMDTSEANNIIKRATAYIGVEPPPLTDEGYLEFSQNGNRSRFEAVYFQRTTRLNLLALAEVLEYKGRFLPTLENDIHAICNVRSWNLPAHDKNLNDFYNRSQHAALFSTEIASNLAYTDWWLGEKLSPEIRAEIRRETNRRIFEPYWTVVRTGVIPDGFWWVRGRNNWNAVCNDNIIRAALILLEDRDDRAAIIASAENSMPFYINGYSPDGYCSEGMGYWNYGYGHFLQMAETILLATDGKLSFYNHPRLEKVAAFARDIQIEENVCPAFADCGVSAKPSTAFLSYIQRRYPSAVFKAIPPQTAPSTSFATTALHCFYDHQYPIENLPQTGVFPPRSLFQDAGIYIGRSSSDAQPQRRRFVHHRLERQAVFSGSGRRGLHETDILQRPLQEPDAEFLRPHGANRRGKTSNNWCQIIWKIRLHRIYRQKGHHRRGHQKRLSGRSIVEVPPPYILVRQDRSVSYRSR